MWSVIYGVGSGATFFYMLELARTILKGYEYDYVYDWNILEKKNRRKEAEKKR